MEDEDFDERSSKRWRSQFTPESESAGICRASGKLTGDHHLGGSTGRRNRRKVSKCKSSASKQKSRQEAPRDTPTSHGSAVRDERRTLEVQESAESQSSSLPQTLELSGPERRIGRDQATPTSLISHHDEKLKIHDHHITGVDTHASSPAASMASVATLDESLDDDICDVQVGVSPDGNTRHSSYEEPSNSQSQVIIISSSGSESDCIVSEPTSYMGCSVDKDEEKETKVTWSLPLSSYDAPLLDSIDAPSLFMNEISSSRSQKKQVSLFNFIPNQKLNKKCPPALSQQTEPQDRATRQKWSWPHSSWSGNTAGAETSRGTTASSRGRKTCPFYKRVPGTNFVVDAFQYGSIPDCCGYFLSHFHADHYQGLTKRFTHTLYCTEVTANLVRLKLAIQDQYIRILPMNEPTIIERVEVTLLDANHCPGSVLLLFRLPNGKNYLHTGDFRFSPVMRELPQLIACPIDELFLDTTYCSPQYDFPRQEEVIGYAVEKSLGAVRTNPTTLIVCGTYTIGKEKVFLAIAEAIDSTVYVTREKKAILDCISSTALIQRVTTNPNVASVHVLPMGKLNMDNLLSYLESWNGKYTSLLAFKPTGWTHSHKRVSLSAIQPHTRGPITTYGIPYSEHSSFLELREFVQFIRPKRVIPTVGNTSPKAREDMQKHFREWLSASSPRPKPKQTTLASVFQK